MVDIVRVALDVPVDQLFDYRASGAGEAWIGRRAIVPFGNARRVGVIFGVCERSRLPESQIKAIHGLITERSALSQNDLALLRFCSQYYHHPLGQTCLTALPPALKVPGERSPRRAFGYHLTAPGQAADIAALPARQIVRRRLLARLQANAALTAREIAALTSGERTALRDFLTLGWVLAIEEPPETLTGPEAQQSAGAHPGATHELTAAQRAAINTIAADLNCFACWLLHGVTGSGKTEVYLSLIERTLAQGKQALVLLPEINLTPQLEARFRARFPTVAIANLHSDVSDAQRAQRFLSAQRGQCAIVIGTRLAVFTPLPRLGLIVVDEEHDPSFKQNEGLRYNARDLAVYRAQQANVPIVLGSATPSLESYAHARSGRYALLRLPERAQPNATLPHVRLVDSTRASDDLSEPLAAALEARLARGEQSLIFINRRGYAPIVLCSSCGWMSECTRCSARMVWHARDRKLHCHYCGKVAAPPPACPSCDSQSLRPLGRGTQRIESALAERFPGARIVRVDRDSMARKLAWSQAMEKIHAGEVDILVGTQMLAKGHDFPRITLVGMIDVDRALYSADFRAAERLFAQIVQVAGRAGRGATPGEVLIHTRHPAHPLFRAAIAQDYAAFASEELKIRQSAGFPPFVFQALLRADAIDANALRRFMNRAASQARALSKNTTVYEPVEPAIARIAGTSRLQLLVQSKQRSSLHEFLHAWRARLSEQKERRVRWAIDVDPLEF